MTNDSTIENRISSNKHFAGDLRRRLEQRHAKGTCVREMIDHLSEEHLLRAYLQHEQQGKEYAAKQRAENGAA